MRKFGQVLFVNIDNYLGLRSERSKFLRRKWNANKEGRLDTCSLTKSHQLCDMMSCLCNLFVIFGRVYAFSCGVFRAKGKERVESPL